MNKLLERFFIFKERVVQTYFIVTKVYLAVRQPEGSSEFFSSFLLIVFGITLYELSDNFVLINHNLFKKKTVKPTNILVICVSEEC